MRQASFAQFTCLSIDVSNLLEARIIITPYNQHVRLLSSEPFGWFAPPKFTRPWGPTFVYGIISLIDLRLWKKTGSCLIRMKRLGAKSCCILNGRNSDGQSGKDCLFLPR